MPGALDLALAALARRALSAREVTVRLLRAGCAQAEIASVLEKLAAGGYLDDRELAYNLAARRAGEGRRGPARVRAELLGRGLDPGLVDRAVSAAFPSGEGEERARQALQKILGGRGLPEEATDRQRLARRLLRQGFSGALVKRLVLDGLAGEAEENDEPWSEDDAR